MGTVEVGDPRGVAMRDFSLAGPIPAQIILQVR